LDSLTKAPRHLPSPLVIHPLPQPVLSHQSQNRTIFTPALRVPAVHCPAESLSRRAGFLPAYGPRQSDLE